jgi:hypothetical protein
MYIVKYMMGYFPIFLFIIFLFIIFLFIIILRRNNGTRTIFGKKHACLFRFEN